MLNKQAGWDHESWGLHGDDGNCFHGSGEGQPFCWISPRSVCAGMDPPLARTWRPGMPNVRFGEGDIVGCGVVHLMHGEPLKRSDVAFDLENGVGFPMRGEERGAYKVDRSHPVSYKRGIFYTLNGKLLGMPFLVDNVPSDVLLWPCVGIDAPWVIDFNIGHRPFCFDIDAMERPIDVQLSDMFDSCTNWPHVSAVPDSLHTSAEERNACDSVTCGSPLQSNGYSSGSSPPPCEAEAEAVVACARSVMMPLVPKFAPRRLLGAWAAAPAIEAIRLYRGPSGNELPRSAWRSISEAFAVATAARAANQRGGRPGGWEDGEAMLQALRHLAPRPQLRPPPPQPGEEHLSDSSDGF